jgi:hypothetical protein
MESVRALVGEVAVREDGPLVVEFGEDRGGEAEDGFRVREDLDDVGAAFDLPVQPLERVGRLDLLPVLVREVRERSWISFASSSISPTLGNCRPSMSATVSS